MGKDTYEVYHYKGFDFLNTEHVSIYYKKPDKIEPTTDKSTTSRIIKNLRLLGTLSWCRKLLKKFTR
jgi:hypothetical protein